MAYSLEFSDRFEDDLDEARLYYREESSAQILAQFLAVVREVLEKISRNPEIFGFKNHRIYREAGVGKFSYIITYRPFKKSRLVNVHSITHTSQSPRARFRRAR